MPGLSGPGLSGPDRWGRDGGAKTGGASIGGARIGWHKAGWKEVRHHGRCAWYIGRAIAEAFLPEGGLVIATDRDAVAGASMASVIGAAVAVLLASDEAPYVTGTEINVDGGLSAGSAATPG